ncbi:MAG: RluA family pseudouridine synthase [Planctomycetota bacterium]
MIDPGFEILYESPACLVVSKPPGLLTQAPPGIDSLEVRIKAFLQNRDGAPGDVYLGVPHRIDRPASGAMVLGKSRRATRELAEQFEHRTVGKIYWACVEGPVAPAAGTWRDFLRKVPGQARAEVVTTDHPHAQLALLDYRSLEDAPWGRWLEIKLKTGRTHQIRVQAASRGHPVLGDAQYGSTFPFGPRHEDERLSAIALHARGLSFRHPKTREPVSVTASLPAAWSALGVKLESDNP